MNFSKYHLMLDLETLGLNPGCSIIQIGAVMFDADEDPKISLSGSKNCLDIVISRSSNKRAKLIEDPDTVDWWQSTRTGKQLLAKTGSRAADLYASLHWFQSWVVNCAKENNVPPDELTVWANGANFDFPILTAAYKACNIPFTAWKFNKEFCFRTVRKTFCPSVYQKFLPHETPHNALHDALAQGRLLQQIITGTVGLPETDSNAEINRYTLRA